MLVHSELLGPFTDMCLSIVISGKVIQDKQISDDSEKWVDLWITEQSVKNGTWGLASDPSKLCDWYHPLIMSQKTINANKGKIHILSIV